MTAYGKTNEGLLAALVLWFLRQPERVRKFVASGLTAEEFGQLSAQAEFPPPAPKVPETPAGPAFPRPPSPTKPGAVQRGKQRGAVRKRKRA